MIIALGELQRVYRAKRRSNRRDELRAYLISGEEPSATAFSTVSRFLYATNAIDNLGLADIWIATATVAERAALFSAIATGLLTT